MSTLLHGDVLEQLKTIETGSVGMILTDPPYNIGYKGAEWDNHRMTVASISDNVTANAPKPIGLNIKEQGLKWIINTNTISVKDITDTLPSNPIQAYNDGDNTIYIDFYNPLKSDDLEANIANFEITTVINTTTTKIPILTLEQSQLNQLRTAG